MGMEGIGKLLLVAGGAIVLVGLLIIVFARLGVPGLGRLPGDILVRRGRLTIYIPLVTMLVVSLALTVVLNLVFRLFRS